MNGNVKRLIDARNDVPGAARNYYPVPAPRTWDKYVDGMMAWLVERWGDQRCPHCDNSAWEILPVVQLAESARWPMSPFRGRGVHPAAPIACTRCGYVAFIATLLVFEPQRPTA